MKKRTTRREFLRSAAAAGLSLAAAGTAVAKAPKLGEPKFIGWHMDAATGQQYRDGEPVPDKFRELCEQFINDIRANRGEEPIDMSIWSREAVRKRFRRTLDELNVV